MTELNIFRYQPFVAVSGNPGVKVPGFHDVLSSHEQEIYSTNFLMKTALSFLAGRTKLIVYYLLLFSLANIAERRVRP